jgi:rhamnosyltransferase
MNLPSTKNTLVLIVTYNPDERFIKSLTIIKKVFQNILVVDNNSGNDVANLIDDSKIHLIKNVENLGIARALNVGAKFALNKKYSWLLMLDQDTIPSYDLLNVFCTVYSAFPNKEKIGQIGVSFENRKKINEKYSRVPALITSGTLLSLEVFSAVGEFRDDFFIDSVDFEYSLRIKKKGYFNLLSPIVAIDHRLGNLKNKKILFTTISSTNHSAVRRYYMARNHVILSIQYFFYFPFWVIKKNYFFILSFLEMLIVDDQKSLKIKKTLTGIRDGLFYKND